MKKRTLRSEVFYAETIERVWKALTDPAELAQWLTKGDFKPRRGHRFKWKEPEGARETLLEDAECEVQEVDAPKRLSYRLEHDAGVVSFVTWTLEPAGEGTRLIIEQELVPTADLKPHPSVVSIALYRRQRALLRLESELASALKRLEALLGMLLREAA